MARAVDVMARAKRICILMIRVKKLFSLLWLRNILKERERKKNVFYEFLSSYKNTSRSLREPDKAVEILVSRLVFPQHISLYSIETRYMFSISNMLWLSGGRRGSQHSVFPKLRLAYTFVCCNHESRLSFSHASRFPRHALIFILHESRASTFLPFST